jgi:hypothetical protein
MHCYSSSVFDLSAIMTGSKSASSKFFRKSLSEWCGDVRSMLYHPRQGGTWMYIYPHAALRGDDLDRDLRSKPPDQEYIACPSLSTKLDFLWLY